MNPSELPTGPALFFCALLPSFGEFSNHAEVDYSVHPPRVHRCHCAIDVNPTSNIFAISPCVFVAEPLGEAITAAGCSGFAFREAAFEPSDAFREFQDQNIRIPRYLWCEISGQAGLNDFGLDRNIRLIVSTKVKALIETGPHEGVIFLPGATAPPDEAIRRILFKKAQKTAEKIYEERRKGTV